MQVRKYHITFIAAIMSLMTCKKLITPPVINAPNHYLVVTGNITIGDSTTINISRTVNISGNASSKPELGAVVTVEGQQGGFYNLSSKNNGAYIAAPLNLNISQKYRLKIITADGKQYASDYVTLKKAPPIDTVNYVINSNGIVINLNTHDATNNTRYYRWDYTETYIIHSAYESHYEAKNMDTTVIRPPVDEIYQCWITDSSSTIIIGSSAKLSSDVISRQQITNIASSSEKLRVRYSILVKQYALTADEYNYFVLLKKNTEQLGGIFDAQPSEITGNIHNLADAAEPVIGYITAGAVTEARIFIDNKNLPGWTANTPYGACTLDSVYYAYQAPSSDPNSPPLITNQVRDLIYPGTLIPIDAFSGHYGGGFTAAFPVCADCTLRGTNKQPAFWK